MDLLGEFDIFDVKEKFRKIILYESEKDYFRKLIHRLNFEYEVENIFPKKKDVFNAFKFKDFDEIRVVILGQDPYHGKNQAHGLSFSIYDENISIPSSLKNIFKELRDDLNISMPKHGNLTCWANQGVLLINSVLTVRSGFANSHKDIGWSIFTDSIIKKISRHRENIVFILWGSFAKQREILIDKSKHFIITSAHPSGLSAHRGFFSSRPFSRTNDYLKKNSIEIIDWEIK